MEQEQTNLNQSQPSFFASRKFWIIILAILILAAVCFGYYYLFMKSKKTVEAPVKTMENVAESSLVESSNQASVEDQRARESTNNIVTKMAAIEIDQVSSAMGEINSTISTFSSANNRR